MNERIKGKTVAITGASGGLGMEIARQAAKSGANLILMARSFDKLEKLRDELIANYSIKASIYGLDVSKRGDIEDTFSKIEHEVGQIDVFVNNAGFGVFDSVLEMDLDEAEGMIETNVLGLITCTKLVLPGMVSRRSGHIINIASQAGKMATPKSSVYSATKHAVLGFTNSLRMEMHGKGVYVTSVNPGPIRTNFFNIADKEGTYIKNIDRLMIDPVKLAGRIVDAMMTGKREINAPGWMNAGSKIYGLFPRTFETLGRSQFNKK
ncbi:oxidoreductase [Pradoshia eiseniae]|uniref:Oxidoreductase n=1 Tax=Pradoshia eiseniae TaxID=2064768 RepID=A0A2S7N3P4_9BACI|nr:SDR family oxidoreductase [Pradoshia eiseniae]PQD96646.1 oxidoreductase [Pradoshia eiseniae]